MIDGLIAAKDIRRGVDDPGPYRPADAVLDACLSLGAPNNSSVTIAFGPWHGSERLRLLTRRLAHKRNQDLLYYTFRHEVLTEGVESTLESFQNITETVLSDIANRREMQQYKHIDLLGFSIGNLALAALVSKFDNWRAATMVTPGHKLAEPFMTGVRTARVSDAYRQEGHTIEELSDKWRPLAPIIHVPAFRGHDTTIILGKRDQYIPHTSGKKLADAFFEDGQKPDVITARGGHVGTITRYALGRIT